MRFTKRIGVGKALLRFRRFLRNGIRAEVACFRIRRQLLSRIWNAAPISAARGQREVFMLLNETRALEGAWALYSFLMCAEDWKVTILSDGTLAPPTIHRLELLFPGISIPANAAHDEFIDATLSKLKLPRNRAWRRQFFFFRKLVDPYLLSTSSDYLLLDSDILHYRKPSEVCVSSGVFVYASDVSEYPTCASREEIELFINSQLPKRFCAGYLQVPKNGVNLLQIEEFLSHPIFANQLSTSSFSHYAEQTLYSILAASHGCRELPETYAMCPDLSDAPGTIMGHYCGGTVRRTLFYTQGVPKVAADIL